MTGPEHYREAERLIAAVTLCGTHPDGSPIVRSDEPQTIALAQVHATLALAAATATNPSGTRHIAVSSADEWRAWKEVCAVPASTDRSASLARLSGHLDRTDQPA